jgi:hypothetical protein
MAGKCVLSCPTGQNTCASGCSDPNWDDQNCGMCGTVCANGMVCQFGSCQACLAVTGVNIASCEGACIDLNNDVNNCGTCGNACTTSSCQAGVCAAAPVAASGQDAPQGITVDTVNVYWTNAGTAAGNYLDGTVMKMPLAGGTPTAIATGQALPTGIATDGVNVYWADLGTAANNYADGSIVMVPIAGGTTTTLATAQAAPQWVAVAASVVYWTATGLTDNVGSVLSIATTAGATATTIASAQASPEQLGLDGMGNVYWTNFGTSANAYTDGSVAMAATTGGAVTTISSGLSGPLGLVVGFTGSNSILIIWTNNLGGTVAAASNAAAQTPIVLASGQSSPASIAISNSGLVWTDEGSGTVMTVAYFGGTPAIVATGQNYPDSIASDASNNIWWTNEGTAANGYTDGSVVKTAP